MRKGPKSETLKMRKKMSGRLGGKKSRETLKMWPMRTLST
jgi:hypothetical protein